VPPSLNFDRLQLRSEGMRSDVIPTRTSNRGRFELVHAQDGLDHAAEYPTDLEDLSMAKPRFWGKSKRGAWTRVPNAGQVYQLAVQRDSLS
jgi:hypothetical protein